MGIQVGTIRGRIEVARIAVQVEEAVLEAEERGTWAQGGIDSGGMLRLRRAPPLSPPPLVLDRVVSSPRYGYGWLW